MRAWFAIFITISLKISEFWIHGSFVLQ